MACAVDTKNWCKETRGNCVKLMGPDGVLGSITAGRAARVDVDDGFAYYSAEFKLADGTHCFGVVLLCEQD